MAILDCSYVVFVFAAMSIPQIFLEDGFICRCIRHLDVLHLKITVLFPLDRIRLRCPLFATTNSVVRRREA